MKKILVLALVLIMCCGLCACGEKSTTIEITEENWTEYFELSSTYNELTITRVEKDDFDEIYKIESEDSFVLKDGYKLGKNGYELKIEFDTLHCECECEVDVENNKVLLGDVVYVNPDNGAASGTATVTDKDNTFGFITSVFPKESSTCYKPTTTITRIEGTLSLVEE